MLAHDFGPWTPDFGHGALDLPPLDVSFGASVECFTVPFRKSSIAARLAFAGESGVRKRAAFIDDAGNENAFEGVGANMSSPYDPEHDPQRDESIDDLMLPEEHPEHHNERTRAASSVREMASRIPESLSAIGRDISRTIERAISAKDDYVVAVKVSHEAQEKLEQLVQAGVFRSRAEAAAFLIDEGIKTQSALFDRVRQKLSEIERLRAELRGMINEGKPDA
jgi:Arc/MetJ-type ribon-helix-helix transcriptional regulator